MSCYYKLISCKGISLNKGGMSDDARKNDENELFI